MFADGIQLSNLLGNGVGGLSFPPRWGLVTPEEIARVDVMYGAFSAAYSGNSVGAVVDHQTRMPNKFEAHVASNFSSPAIRSVQHAQQLQSLADQRITRQSQRRMVVVVGRESYGQRWPAPYLSPPPAEHRHGSSGTTAVTGAVQENNNAGLPWWDHRHRHAVPHAAGPRQDQDRRRLSPTVRGATHVRLVAERCWQHARELPAQTRRDNRFYKAARSTSEVAPSVP